MPEAYDALVVGAGFAGAVVAERLATAGRTVRVVERRKRLGGNAHDFCDDAGVLVHAYGPHIFHTGLEHVVAYLDRFTGWHAYEHRVLAHHKDDHYPIPINRTTLARFFDVELADEAAAKDLLARVREPRKRLLTSEDVVLNAVGSELYEAFFRGYTLKQWGRDPSQLDASVCGRIPTRTNDDDRYFTDPFQQMPDAGYTAMFTRMLDHPRIRVDCATPYDPAMRDQARHLIWTGRLDEFFDFSQGRLPYRSLRFEFEHLGTDRHQQVGTVNEPDASVPYTRTTEFKHITGQKHPGTTVVREYPLPAADGEPYYPIPSPETADLVRRYRELANTEAGVWFVGRLAMYKYLNMDATIAVALQTAQRLL